MEAQTKNCQNCKNAFEIDPEDFDFYEKMKVPAPTWCPRCRMIRRMGWHGERLLYKRDCDFSGDSVITFYHPDSPHKIYRQDIWWSDKWDPKSYGRDYDSLRAFFDQWGELSAEVPLPALYTEHTTMINSDYCNAAASLKNCYLIFSADASENCGYGTGVNDTKDSYDLMNVHFLELSNDALMVDKSYKVFSSQYCEECQNIYFSRDLVGCLNCIGCINLKNKNYHIFNEPVSKEEFEKFLLELKLDSYKNRVAFKGKAEKFFLSKPRRAFHGRKNVNSTGDYLFNCKNVKDSYLVYGGENLRYCQLLEVASAANAYDYTHFALKAELVYECVWSGLSVNNLKFCFWNYHAHDLEYCFGCHGSGNLFGCVGLKNSEYCILNRQYTKEDYFKLKEQIIEDMKRKGEYGEFFPTHLSPWSYNESIGNNYAPLTKDEALNFGFIWREDDPKNYVAATIEIPDSINDVTESILKEILKCDKCGRNYKIIGSELDFYKRMGIPIPHQCPLCRDQERIARLNPIALYNRVCDKCGKEIKSSYAPDGPEIVYCEECYNNEVA
jgi:hypothetical protein